jgi:hypothetical protein
MAGGGESPRGTVRRNPSGCTFVGVARFIDPEWLVEVEVDCFQSNV